MSLPTATLHAFRFLLYVLFPLLLALGCASGPRVVEVSSRTRLQEIDVADQALLMRGGARLGYEPQNLPIDQQRQEFYVRWTPRWKQESSSTSGPEPERVDLVKFEYRQLDKPNAVKEQTFVPPVLSRAADVDSELLDQPRWVRCSSHTFEVRGEEFRAGGPVSAWRVTIWDGDRLLAERKSALW
ncbi:MAG TPA: hypothetical protein VL486_01115 [Verrucomicrobiae bacterium]|nr:hypothetical protein [Verrucomicrobiae bacterium]